MHGMLEQQESTIQKAAPGNCLGSLQTLTVLIKNQGISKSLFCFLMLSLLWPQPP